MYEQHPRLAGIGSKLKKLGKKIDKAVRKTTVVHRLYSDYKKKQQKKLTKASQALQREEEALMQSLEKEKAALEQQPQPSAGQDLMLIARQFWPLAAGIIVVGGAALLRRRRK